ncbi:fimbria/pilus outer membrane usher protein [Morganella psychrotolerans]|uniref:fimbria/pilus outer membrane usher protein n=1 Tax=Morganella psychrotolerans TaxID=368603 RepID=UPI0039B02AF0
MNIQNLRISSFILISAALYTAGAFAAPATELLYLDVSVNKREIPDLVPVKKEGDIFWLSEEESQSLNLDTETLFKQDGWIKLTPQPGLTFNYDPLTQSLSITAESNRLTGHQNKSSAEQGFLLKEDQIAPAIKGGVINYDLFASQDKYTDSASAYTELRAFGYGQGNFSSSFNTRISRTNDITDNTFTRLMTSWTYSNVDSLNVLTLGDSITGGQSGTNRVRFGGIRFSHNYTVQPNFNTASQPIYSSTAVLPSTVDLYIGGMKNSTQRIEPGQFTLNTAPYFSGAGNAQLVITDINGQQQRIDLSLYNTNQLLSPGLYTWDISTGWLRDDYSDRSFSYNPRLMVVGDGRYGLNNKITLSAHSEVNSSLQNTGAGYHWLISPDLGVFRVDAGLSRYRNNNGSQWGAGWQWNNPQFNISADHQQFSGNYADISVMAGNTLPKTSDSIFISQAFDSIGTLGSGWVTRQYQSAKVQYANISWTRTWDNSFTLSVNATKELANQNDHALYFMLNVPLSSEHYVSLQTSYEDHRVNQQIQYQKSLVPDKTGWGWGMSSRAGHNNNLHADISRRNEINEWQLGYNRSNNENSWFAGSNGAIGLLDGQFYFMRTLGNAFAIADTSGIPEIPVYLQNVEVGKTDENGFLLLNDLYGYEPQKIRINALSLPADYRIRDTEKSVILRDGSGTRVTFNLYQTRALLLKLTQKSGQPIPFAAKVTTEDKTQKTIVGYDSRIYLETWTPGETVNIAWPEGQCHIQIPDIKQSTAAVTEENAICL